MAEERAKHWGIPWSLSAVTYTFTFSVAHLLMCQLSHALRMGSPPIEQSLSPLSTIQTLDPVCSNIPSPHPPPCSQIFVYSVMRTWLETHPPRASLRTWVTLYVVHWKSEGTHVLFLPETARRSSFPPSHLLLSVYWPPSPHPGWSASLCICSQVTNLATWAGGRGQGPRSPAAASQRERKCRWCDFSNPSLLICRMGTVSPTLCASGEGQMKESTWSASHRAWYLKGAQYTAVPFLHLCCPPHSLAPYNLS